jgi:membrane fusion protein (multidrug efflux system)
VLDVAPESVHLNTEWIATLAGYANAQIRAQVSGYLLRRVYREGGVVKKGEVLFEIDPRPFETALQQARARLAEAQAQQSKAERDLKRDTPLAEQRAIAQSQLDNDIEAVSAAKASVASATAAMEAASLNLEFTKVTSLIDGVASIATAQIGDLVGPNTILATVSQVDPIKAYFPLSEREYLPLAQRLNRTAGAPWAGDEPLRLVLADGSVYPRPGRFVATDRDIDVKTGTIRVAAEFPNPERLLRPGQFGRVRAGTTVLDRALLVPQRAVTETQGITRVRVVGSDGTVSTRAVTLGDRVDSRWVVTDGLKPGDRVVVEGPTVAAGVVVRTRPYVVSAPSGPAGPPPPAAAGR